MSHEPFCSMLVSKGLFAGIIPLDR
jgi:hypothetical protein